MHHADVQCSKSSVQSQNGFADSRFSMFFNNVYYSRLQPYNGFIKDFTYDLIYDAALSYTIKAR